MGNESLGEAVAGGSNLTFHHDISVKFPLDKLNAG